MQCQWIWLKKIGAPVGVCLDSGGVNPPIFVAKFYTPWGMHTDRERTNIMSQAIEVNAATFDNEVINCKTPVLVDFWAGWCMPCKMLAPTIDEIAADFSGKVKVVKIDVDSNQALASKFAVRGIPTLLIINEGREVDRIVGVQPKAAIAAKLNELLGA